MCWRRSNVRTLFFSLLRGSANPSGPATLPRVWRARSVRQTNNLIAIEAHADSQRVLSAHRLDTDNVAGTAPFDGLLAGNFRGHLQKDFHRCAFLERKVGGEINAALGQIHRFGGLRR